MLGGLGLWALASGLGPGDAATRLVDGLEGTTWGPVIFVAAYLVRPLVLISAAALTVAAGFLYGPVLGLALVVVASNGSAMVAYAVARWVGAGALAREDGEGLASRYATRLRTRSFETVVLMRLLFLPYDLVSYLAGALRIRPWQFLAGTALGSAPGTVAFVLAGASLERFDGDLPGLDLTTLAAAAALAVASLVLARALRRREGTSGRPAGPPSS